MKISIRALKLTENPQYGHLLKDQSTSFLEWKFETDKKLTVTYSASFDLLRVVLCEAIATLLNQKNLNNLFTLNFKEVENFLRDQNDIPAFSDDMSPLFLEILKKLTVSLFNFLQKKMDKKNDFIGENQFWKQVFLGFHEVEFILFENEILYFFNKRNESIVSFVISE